MGAHQPRGKALKMDGAKTVRLYSTMGTEKSNGSMSRRT